MCGCRWETSIFACFPSSRARLRTKEHRRRSTSRGVFASRLSPRRRGRCRREGGRAPGGEDEDYFQSVSFSISLSLSLSRTSVDVELARSSLFTRGTRELRRRVAPPPSKVSRGSNWASRRRPTAGGSDAWERRKWESSLHLANGYEVSSTAIAYRTRCVWQLNDGPVTPGFFDSRGFPRSIDASKSESRSHVALWYRG